MGTGKQRDQVLPPNALEAVERYATEVSSELHRFDSQFFDQFSDASDWQTQLALLEAYCLSRFDLMAEQMLFLSVSPDAVAINPLYEKCLNRVSEEKFLPFLSTVLNPLRADLREDVISRINLKLTAKKLTWLAEAKTAQLLRHSTVARNAKGLILEPSPKPTKALGKLPPKGRDLSELFAQARLAPRQMEIAALAFEHEMTRSQIARRLGLNWKTVDESLAGAKNRIARVNGKTKADAKRAIRNRKD